MSIPAAREFQPNRKSRSSAKAAAVAKALGHPKRLELVELLAEAPQTVEKLCTITETKVKSVSAHLKALSRAGLVASSREGRFQRYRITGPKVAELIRVLREAADLSAPAVAELIEEVKLEGADAVLDAETAEG